MKEKIFLIMKRKMIFISNEAKNNSKFIYLGSKFVYLGSKLAYLLQHQISDYLKIYNARFIMRELKNSKITVIQSFLKIF